MYRLDKHRGGVSSLCYHFITCVKYRKKAFARDDIAEYVMSVAQLVADEHKVEIVAQDCGEDHLHILFRVLPTVDILAFINALKGRTSRLVRKKYKDHLEKMLWGDNFWSPSYFLATTGNVTLDVLKQYVESQREGMDGE